ncbi:MAG TPA: thioredoxin family protein [bacterium]|nr:thioredoxin family protein [bacterium]HPP30598.1 thioredoxin family protein [bacterium]
MGRDAGKKTIKRKGVPKDKIVIGVIVVLVMLMFIAKQNKNSSAVQQTKSIVSEESIFSEKLPHLIEFGSEGCVPCKMMKPIIAELDKEYKGQMVIKFIDVYENPSIAEKYGIRAIPTQIFFDADGKEIARHTGFFPKDEILAQWKSLGYEFSKIEDSK